MQSERRVKTHSKKGEMTVYLALSMTVLLAFVLSVIEAARVGTIRFQIECASDMSMYSGLAEYQRELLKRFDLFFVDTAYGRAGAGFTDLQFHLKEYMDYNLDAGRELVLPGRRDFLALSAVSAEVVSASLATDEDCLVLKSQAVSGMKEAYGMNLAEDILRNMNCVKEYRMEEGIERQRKENRQKIKERDGKRVKVAENEWKRIYIDDPAGHIPVRDSGMMYLVTKQSGGVSGAAVNLKNCPSRRECSRGEGLAPEREAADGFADEILFGEYLLEHLGCYTNKKPGGCLSYEVEYVLGGRAEDAANLKYVLNRILLIREISNYMYLQQDDVKRAQAEIAAIAVSAVVFMPELADILKEGILLAWAYTESVNDIKILLEKGKVPLLKTAEDWKLGFFDMLHYESALEGGGSKSGLSYEDYLRMFLAMENKRQKAFRFADIAEMDVRRLSGNEAFRLDNCLESMEVDFTAESRYGYSYTIRRRYGYEMLE